MDGRVDGGMDYGARRLSSLSTRSKIDSSGSGRSNSRRQHLRAACSWGPWSGRGLELIRYFMHSGVVAVASGSLLTLCTGQVQGGRLSASS